MFKEFLVQGAIFVLFLLIVIVVKFIRQGKTNISLNLSISPKICHFLLAISLGLCLLTIPPISAKGYDCPIFVFTVDFIERNDWTSIFRTDRPLTFLVMFLVGQILNIPGRYSSLNVDWTLENKTIILPSTVYAIEQSELEIVNEADNTGVYIVKYLLEQEKTDWLGRWGK